MEFTQLCSTIWWVHNTMCTLNTLCTRIWCALSQWFLWSRGCRYIKTPHVAPWTDHLSNKMQSQTTGTGAGKKTFCLHLNTWTIKWDKLGPFLYLFRGVGAMSEVLKAWSLFIFFCHSSADVLEAFSILLMVWYWLGARFVTLNTTCLFHKSVVREKHPTPKRLVPVTFSFEVLSPTS